MAANLAAVLVLLLLLPVPSSSSHLTFQIYGNVYPADYFYVTMKIGSQEFNLDVDTGSVLTWVQCHVPGCAGTCKRWDQHNPVYELTSGKLVPKNDPFCQVLHREPGDGDPHKCQYHVGYVVGSSHGFLVRDKFPLPTTRNPPTIAFGCGYDQSGPAKAVLNGVLGLGRNSIVSLASQLKQENVVTKHVIAHCISTRGGGFLYIGDYTHSSGNFDWVSMDRNAKEGHYSPNVLAKLTFNGASVSEKMKLVFDSGSTFTYFDTQHYKATKDAVVRSLDKSLTQVPDHEFELCWRGPKAFNGLEDIKPLFKSSIYLTFEDGQRRATLNIPPENYLFIKDGVVCFGIMTDPRVGDINIIGAITMLDKIVVYDNEESKIKWARDSCNRKSESVINSRL